MRPLIDTGAMARTVVSRRAWVAGAWLAAVLAAGVFAAKLPAVVQGGADPIPGSETGWVIRAIEGGWGRGAYYQTPIVVSNPSLPPGGGPAADRLPRRLHAHELRVPGF